MERKIGEIFEYNGEWYQCIIGNGCENCAFNERKCYTFPINNDPIGECCADRRKDNKDVIFKNVIMPDEPCMYFNAIDNTIEIEIKQNKEDMEEKKLNLKPFDLEAAKAGKPVCTRDGHKVRIICFDYNGETGDYPIVALVHYNKGNKCYERVLKYTSDGMFNKYGDCRHDDDLMMLPEKKEGWAKVRKDINLYDTKEEADRKMIGNDEYVTAKVCWEE